MLEFVEENAYQVMEEIQNNNIGYLAVSLNYTNLFSAPGASTSSEIPQKNKTKWVYRRNDSCLLA